MVALPERKYNQILLFRIRHEDDVALLNNSESGWFSILCNFPWEEYREHGAAYYEALYEFNLTQEKERRGRKVKRAEPNVESKGEARERLMFDRDTMRKLSEEKAIIFAQEFSEATAVKVEPASISPGIVPERSGGKKAKCFFSLFKSFIGVTLMGFACEPKMVYQLLCSNPSFVRACGFAQKYTRDEYCHLHVPHLRKLEQFDQIMREYGLWDKIKIEEVRHNLSTGLIKKEKNLVGDTTHYEAYSGFETVKYKDSAGKDQKKSQSKMTKNCRCSDRDNCEHPWALCDDGAGTIVKSPTRMYWGHKAGILGFPEQGIPLDMVAISDGATFDGETLYPHVETLFEKIPEIKVLIKRVLYDSACDSQDLKDKFQEDFGIELKASINPRRKKELTEDLPRGISRITPYGSVICTGGHEMDYQGMRQKTGKYIYQAPKDSQEAPVCFSCQHQEECCPNAVTGRTVNISFGLLPHIDASDPPMAKRFKAIMSKRTSVERMIKQLKCDLGDSRLSKRGNDSFQAYLDKTMIAYHILLRN